MINTQLKLVFVDIPKTGSSAIKTFLIRGFHQFSWQSSSNPAWTSEFIYPYARYNVGIKNTPERYGGVRHEPLISKFINVNGLTNYFIFTIVRNPFDRFKSALYHSVLLNHYKLRITSISTATRPGNLGHCDPWFIYPNENISNYSKIKKIDELQVDLILNQLKIIKAKGGFKVTGTYETPVHFWPQHYFTDLTTPVPLKFIIIKNEHLKEDFPTLKRELSYITGVDVTKEELDHIDPIASIIFSSHNPNAIDTIGVKFKAELEIAGSEGVNPEFCEKYPTFNDFVPDFKETKNHFIEKWDSILEEHRGLIEEVYAEDYRTFEYERQIITDLPKL